MHRLLALLASAALLLTSTACHTLDDDRIPPATVNIAFATVAEWNVYGVSGAMDYRVFSREERLPSGYPFLATTHTGYGGVLLVADVLGSPRAFDRACPVECRSNVRVEIDSKTNHAVCPVCHSEYDVFSLGGHPVAGEAARKGYGLRPYRVGPGRSGTYMLISY